MMCKAVSPRTRFTSRCPALLPSTIISACHCYRFFLRKADLCQALEVEYGHSCYFGIKPPGQLYCTLNRDSRVWRAA